VCRVLRKDFTHCRAGEPPSYRQDRTVQSRVTLFHNLTLTRPAQGVLAFGVWTNRKFRAVAIQNCSSWALACRQRAAGADYFAESGYDRRVVALAAGAVPLRVQGSLIGAVGVSGLAEEEDHRFVVDALLGLLKRISVAS
jgi:uncharacterized protein (UPF0303 family)